MKIKHNSKDINSDFNTEILKDDEFGMNVTVKYKLGGIYSKHGVRSETFYNLTEVHVNFQLGGRTAFESNIHSTGQTIDNDEIENIEIVDATELSESYSG